MTKVNEWSIFREKDIQTKYKGMTYSNVM